MKIIKFRKSKNVFSDSQFRYSPLILMFYRIELSLKMQKLHHESIKVIYQSNKSYEELRELNETVSIHQRQLRFLVYQSLQRYLLLKPPV